MALFMAESMMVNLFFYQTSNYITALISSFQPATPNRHIFQAFYMKKTFLENMECRKCPLSELLGKSIDLISQMVIIQKPGDEQKTICDAACRSSQNRGAEEVVS